MDRSTHLLTLHEEFRVAIRLPVSQPALFLEAGQYFPFSDLFIKETVGKELPECYPPKNAAGTSSLNIFLYRCLWKMKDITMKLGF
jgi:hypothetical protein